MLRVLESLLHDHDPRLVLVAAAICAFGAVSTMNVSARANGARRRMLWLVLVAVCAGASVWATHFIAMLAYMQGVPVTYDPGLTLLSFLVGSIVMGFGFALGIRGGDASGMRLMGGATIGLGVVLLHYIGMAAMQMPGEVTYQTQLVIASILFSVGFGAPAVYFAFGPARRHGRLVGALFMIVMVVSLHFTAMGAVQVQHAAMTMVPTDGVTRSVLATAVAVASISVLLIGMAGAIVDQRVTRRLAADADRFRALADGAFEGIVVHHNGRIIDANAAARTMFGLDGDLSEASIRDWFDTRDAWEQNHGEAPAEVRLRGSSGREFPAEICRRAIQLPDGSAGELLAVRDLTARKESEARIAHLALHDPLTELPNRRFFTELAQKSIAHAVRSQDRFAMLALDLDNFKLVNDMYGHAGGDAVLGVVAQRITATLRESDVCARFGGDEFAILESYTAQPSQAIALAERLLEALQVPVLFDGVEIPVSVSIGVALFPDDGKTVEELLRNADTAMYRAKADGKSTCRFFEPQMDAALVARRRLEQALRRAVANNGLTVVYQPIVDSTTRAPIAFEALLRWNDEQLGTVPPNDFIPVAEETGLIVQLGEFVLRRACEDAVHWAHPIRVAVNLSAVQFRRKGLLDTLRAALHDSGLPGERLEIEVTETLLMENRDDALRQLNQMRELGVRISMDDFGTGYSSLSYLQSFPFDKIKIDRAFVSDLPGNAQNASIVRAVTAMGKSLRMRVAAEGVETDIQATMLRGLECDEIQGFLIGRPMNREAVTEFLEAEAFVLA